MIIIMHRCKLQKMCVHYGAGSGTTAGEGEDTVIIIIMHYVHYGAGHGGQFSGFADMQVVEVGTQSGRSTRNTPTNKPEPPLIYIQSGREI